MVDDVRGTFEADLRGIVRPMLPGGTYFRAWSRPLPEDLAQEKSIPKETVYPSG